MSINYYEPDDDEAARVLQEVYDSGLLWAINHGVLHQYGYAIGVASSQETPELVERLILIKLDADEDSEGEIIFSQAAGLKGYKKYLDFLNRRFDATHRRKGHEMGAEGEVFE